MSGRVKVAEVRIGVFAQTLSDLSTLYGAVSSAVSHGSSRSPHRFQARTSPASPFPVRPLYLLRE
eukprot:8831898-Pyramimonas_sp.AAC.1